MKIIDPDLVAKKIKHNFPLDIREAALMTGYARQTLYDKVSKEAIPCRRNGKLTFIPKELEAWLNEHKQITHEAWDRQEH